MGDWRITAIHSSLLFRHQKLRARFQQTRRKNLKMPLRNLSSGLMQINQQKKRSMMKNKKHLKPLQHQYCNLWQEVQGECQVVCQEACQVVCQVVCQTWEVQHQE